MNNKLKGLDELKDIITGAKADGKKVIFANGVFDIIHVGHVRYLKEAKTFGDMLVVAVNSDVSTRKIKGEGRPYTSEDERVEILGELACVDYMVLFDDPDVRRLLMELKPNVQVKGTDYTKDNVPERDIVHSYGGEVMIAGDEKTHSSSEMISTLKGQ